MYKLIFYIPEQFKEKVKLILFEKGAGKYKNYDMCSFETKGDAQFRPLKNSNPFIGHIGKIEKVIEYRVEIICKEEIIVDIIKALIKEHPYEEPAYEIYKIIDIDIN